MTARIEAFEPRHWPSLGRLYARYFGSWSWERFRARWSWQFERNPWRSEGAPRVLVGAIGDEVVAHAAAFPLPLWSFGQRSLVWSSGDLVADPRHRLLVFQLSRAIEHGLASLNTGMRAEAERLATFQGHRHLAASATSLVFPRRRNGAVQRGLRRRLPGPLRALAGPALAEAVATLVPTADPAPCQLPPRPQALEPISRFTKEHDELWQELEARIDCALERSSTYLNWRYVDGLAARLRRLALRGANGRLRGFVIAGPVVELADDRVPCGLRGEILELIVAEPRDHDAIRTLAAAALHELELDRVDSVAATGLCAEVTQPLLDLGFVARPSHTPVLIRLEPEALAKATAPSTRWYTSAGDGDQLFATLS